MGCIGKNPTPTLARNKVKIEYISGGQLSPHELAFGVELGSNPHSKMSRSSVRNIDMNYESVRNVSLKILKLH